MQYDGPVTDATAASHVLYQDDVDMSRFDLDVYGSMDAEASSLEDGTLVFEVAPHTRRQHSRPTGSRPPRVSACDRCGSCRVCPHLLRRDG